MENNYQDQNQPVYESSPVYQPIVEEPKKVKVFGIISLIAGIASVLLGCCYGSSIPFAIAAIIMACIDRSKNGKMSAMSVIGLICGILGALAGVVFVILLFVGAIGSAASSSSMYYY